MMRGDRAQLRDFMRRAEKVAGGLAVGGVTVSRQTAAAAGLLDRGGGGGSAGGAGGLTTYRSFPASSCPCPAAADLAGCTGASGRSFAPRPRLGGGRE